MTKKRKVGVIGLGYVGLPVAVALGMNNEVVGFDINEKRISELRDNIDSTLEVDSDSLKASNLRYSSNINDLKEVDFYIVTVPTPIDDSKKPDLTPVLSATRAIGTVLSKGDIVVYESTVYPGVCEEVCLPVLEEVSGLKSIVDFKIGYSPERINPGDKEHSFTKIVKVVSAQDVDSLKIVSEVYSSVVEAGIYEASSIKVAEAAKVIENTQRDINIALMNELAVIFDKMDIDTKEVLSAAGTKWNFLNFTPGLVGGHCIGVDPYYLTYKAEQLGCQPDMILSGRRINDNVSKFVAEKTVKFIISQGKTVKGSKVGVFGLTFKENCPDFRNSKVFDIVEELLEYGICPEITDPWLNKEDLPQKYQSYFKEVAEIKNTEAIVLAVSHNCLKEITPEDYRAKMNERGVFIDIKSVFTKKDFEKTDILHWRL